MEENNELFPCDKCKGEGKFLVPGKQIDEDTYMAVFKICDKCLGEGKLDWVEMAMGKKKTDPFAKEICDDLNSLLEEDYDDIEECYPAKTIRKSPSRVKKR